ncbi:Uncharacterised protein [Bacteroides heparinolyticus]|uniref:Uncharacterized protein n=1 Tax=Prevotella heparinolytica TaxID=28113 RepID=A0A449I1A1_9BACE|nr:Uncharacterised protein [Bacteroides heparinolyticus]
MSFILLLDFIYISVTEGPRKTQTHEYMDSSPTLKPA